MANMAGGFSNEDNRQPQTQSRYCQAEEERSGAKPRNLSDPPSAGCGSCDGTVSGSLVEAHGRTALPRPHEVDLHDDRDRP
jgi:hypothetical protein